MRKVSAVCEDHSAGEWGVSGPVDSEQRKQEPQASLESSCIYSLGWQKHWAHAECLYAASCLSYGVRARI